MLMPLLPLSMLNVHVSLGLGFSSGTVVGGGEVVEFRGVGVSVGPGGDIVEFEGVNVGNEVGGGYRTNDSEVGSVIED